MNDIATLNDNFRKSFIGGEVLLTVGIDVEDRSKFEDVVKLAFKIYSSSNQFKLLKIKEKVAISDDF